MGKILDRLRPRRPPAPDPFAIAHGVLDALERNAVLRGETQAIGHIREARKTVTREALKPVPDAA